MLKRDILLLTFTSHEVFVNSALLTKTRVVHLFFHSFRPQSPVTALILPIRKSTGTAVIKIIGVIISDQESDITRYRCW